MTFIAGVCRVRGAILENKTLQTMAKAQGKLAPDGIIYASIDGAEFCRGLFSRVPEDKFDRQPMISTKRRAIVVADARIDNRSDMLRFVGLPPKSDISDGDLVCRVFLAEGNRALDLLRGDFALACWDENERTLTLARDISGQRPLHYELSNGIAKFSTMPHGLLAVRSTGCRIDKLQLSKFITDIPRGGRQTFFQNMERVEPGSVVRIGPQGIRSRRFWVVGPRSSKRRSDADYIVEMRYHLHRATQRRLRGATERVGAQLSAGLDSSAVAVTAAIEMLGHGGKVFAFTSAPRESFCGPVPKGRVADESVSALATASLYPNMEHSVVRANGLSTLDVIAKHTGLFGEPMGLPCNQIWLAAISDAAQSVGIQVMLTGEAGNYSFSSGNVNTIHQYISERKFLGAVREIAMMTRNGASWRGALFAAFSPWVPTHIWNAYRNSSWGSTATEEGHALLSDAATSLLPADPRSAARSARPRRDRRRWQAELLQGADPGVYRKGTLANWQIDERDPTADRDLVEFCLELPPDQLLRGGVTRRLARLAAADRLPDEVLFGDRGYQGADWYERATAEDVIEFVDSLRDTIEAGGVLDFNALARRAQQWPGVDWSDGTVIARFRYGLLRAISAASFQQQFESGSAISALQN